MPKAQLIDLSHPDHHQKMAQILNDGGIVGAIWGHHLYFLACNAYNPEAVEKMNLMKGRPGNQVFAAPGAVDEAEEFADLEKSHGLKSTALTMGMEPKEYLEFLFRKFPIAVELYASKEAPDSVTFTKNDSKTIWIAAHMSDKNYSKLLKAVRDLRKKGEKIMFAGTSLNLRNENTLTVKELDTVVEDFGNKIAAISVHPKKNNLKRLSFSTSCSVVSFLGVKPKLLRVGNTSPVVLKKYIPNLEVPSKVSHTRKSGKPY